MVCITIEDESWVSVRTESKWYSLFSELFARAIRDPGFSVSLLLTNDDQIREINRIHRNIDKPTNVLSFPFYSPEELNFINTAGSSASEAQAEQAYSTKQNTSPQAKLFPSWNEKKKTRLRNIWSRWRAKRILIKSAEQSVQWSDSKKEACGAFSREYENMLLGDIVMSYNTIQDEASLFGKSFEARAGHLFVHGLLHVLGHDHVFEQDRSKMEKLETEILASFGINNLYISSRQS